MSNYRERLEAAAALPAYERARRAKDEKTMVRLLETAKFTPLEIESILWAKGDVGEALTEEQKRKQFWDKVIGRIGITVVSGLILGGVFVYYSSGLESSHRASSNKLGGAMNDFRSPEEAYYRPFIWGFVLGAIGGLVTGTLVYDPSRKKP